MKDEQQSPEKYIEGLEQTMRRQAAHIEEQDWAFKVLVEFIREIDTSIKSAKDNKLTLMRYLALTAKYFSKI